METDTIGEWTVKDFGHGDDQCWKDMLKKTVIDAFTDRIAEMPNAISAETLDNNVQAMLNGFNPCFSGHTGVLIGKEDADGEFEPYGGYIRDSAGHMSQLVARIQRWPEQRKKKSETELGDERQPLRWTKEKVEVNHELTDRTINSFAAGNDISLEWLGVRRGEKYRNRGAGSTMLRYEADTVIAQDPEGTDKAVIIYTDDPVAWRFGDKTMTHLSTHTTEGTPNEPTSEWRYYGILPAGTDRPGTVHDRSRCGVKGCGNYQAPE